MSKELLALLVYSLLFLVSQFAIQLLISCLEMRFMQKYMDRKIAELEVKHGE